MSSRVTTIAVHIMVSLEKRLLEELARHKHHGLRSDSNHGTTKEVEAEPAVGTKPTKP